MDFFFKKNQARLSQRGGGVYSVSTITSESGHHMFHIWYRIIWITISKVHLPWERNRWILLFHTLKYIGKVLFFKADIIKIKLKAHLYIVFVTMK